MARPHGTRARRALLVAMTVVALAVLVPGASAHAASKDEEPGPNGELTNTGGQATAVDIVVEGSGLRGAPGRRRVVIPAVCWWQAAVGPADDPAAMLAAFEDGSLRRLVLANFAGRSWMQWTKGRVVDATAAEFQAAAKQPVGALRWYMGVCRDGATHSDYFKTFEGGYGAGIRFAAFATGQVPPARVAPQDLAVYAEQQLELLVPQVDRNPRITAAGGATLVGLPTWFWVTDPAAVGGPSGTRFVRATAGDVWAQVDARFDALRISSPVGETSCTPAQARTAYRAGIPDSAACTVAFTRASVAYPGGWPVTSAAGWQVSWTGSGGTGAELGPRARTWSTAVPVAEAQALVSVPR